MTGGSVKMQNRNQDSFGMSGLRKMFRKKRNRILLYIALALSLPPVFVALYVFLPEVYIELVGVFLPDEQYRIPVRIGSKEYKLPGTGLIRTSETKSSRRLSSAIFPLRKKWNT